MKRSNIFAIFLLMQMMWGIPVTLFSQGYEQCLKEYANFTEWGKIPKEEKKATEVTKCFITVAGPYNHLFKRIHNQPHKSKQNFITLNAIKKSIIDGVASDPSLNNLSDNLGDVIGENNDCDDTNFYQKKAMLALVLAKRIQADLAPTKPEKSGPNPFASLQQLVKTNKKHIETNKNSLEEKADESLVFLLLGLVFLLILLHAVQWVYFHNKLKKGDSQSPAKDELQTPQINEKITALEKRLETLEKQAQKNPKFSSSASPTPTSKKSQKAETKANRREQAKTKAGKSQQSTAPIPQDIPRFYSPPPDQGLFFGNRLVDSPRPNEHVYVIHMINDSEGEYEIRTDTETLQYAFNMVNSLVNPAAKLINAPGKINIGQDSFRQMKGKIKREHKNWKIVKKLEIIFDKR